MRHILKLPVLVLLLIGQGSLNAGGLILGWNEELPPDMVKKPILRMALIDAVLGEAFELGMIGVDAPVQVFKTGQEAMEALSSEGLRNGADKGVYFTLSWSPGETGTLGLTRVFYSIFSIGQQKVLAEGLLNLPPMNFPSVNEIPEGQEAAKQFLDILRRYL